MNMAINNTPKNDITITKLESEIQVLSINTKRCLAIYLLILVLVLKDTFIH